MIVMQERMPWSTRGDELAEDNFRLSDLLSMNFSWIHCKLFESKGIEVRRQIERLMLQRGYLLPVHNHNAAPFLKPPAPLEPHILQARSASPPHVVPPQFHRLAMHPHIVQTPPHKAGPIQAEEGMPDRSYSTGARP
jgi:hypothetical protein